MKFSTRFSAIFTCVYCPWRLQALGSCKPPGPAEPVTCDLWRTESSATSLLTPHNRGRLHSLYNSDYPTLSSNRANLTLLYTRSCCLYRFHTSNTSSYCIMLTDRRAVNSPSLSLSPNKSFRFCVKLSNFNPLKTKRICVIYKDPVPTAL